MVQAVVSHGYEATTAREVARLAGVSTRTLYERFPAEGGSKQQCFLATFDAIVDRVMGRVIASAAGARGRRGRPCYPCAVFAEELARDPQASRIVLVEALGAGPVALERMRLANARFEAMVSASFERGTRRAPVAPIVVQGIVAGVARVARVRLMDGRAPELPDLVDELYEWALCYRSKAALHLEGLGRAPVPVRAATVGTGIGSGDLSSEEQGVRDARSRILRAASELAVREGYRALSVERIVADAGVRGRTFAALFEDRQECFLQAFELLGEDALGLAGEAGLTIRSGPGGVYRAIAALMEHTAREPVFAGMAFVEIFALGPAGLPTRERLMERFGEEIVVAACTRSRRSRPPRELALQASVGAVWGIAHHHVVNGKAAALPELAGQLSYMLLAPILGPEKAVKAILAEHASLRATREPRL